jgi:hypothetical protein
MTKKAGRPRKRGEAATQRTLWVTDEGWNNFGAVAAKLGLSRSELMERIARDEDALMRMHCSD